MNPKDMVYNLLSEKISTGEIQPDGKFTEGYLVENLGLSRTPIREALIHLSAEGIIQKEANKGYTLKKLSVEEIEDLYELIGYLDGKIAQLTVGHLSEDDFTQMQYMVDVMYASIKNGLYTKYNELQMQFHNFYMSKCPNQILVSVVNRLKYSFVGKSYAHADKQTLQKVLEETNNEHEEIINLFKQKKTKELQSYFENVHWNVSRAKYDLF